MVNKEKSLKRERTRLRKSQNPQQIDYKRMDQRRTVKTEFWKLKKKGTFVPAVVAATKKTEKKPKPEKEKKKKVKEPELEVIEEEFEAIDEEPEIEEIDEELEDLYSYDEDLDAEFADDDDVEEDE
jgi:hypothetical protein